MPLKVTFLGTKLSSLVCGDYTILIMPKWAWNEQLYIFSLLYKTFGFSVADWGFGRTLSVVLCYLLKTMPCRASNLGSTDLALCPHTCSLEAKGIILPSTFDLFRSITIIQIKLHLHTHGNQVRTAFWPKMCSLSCWKLWTKSGTVLQQLLLQGSPSCFSLLSWFGCGDTAVCMPVWAGNK